MLEDSEAVCATGQGTIKIFFDKYEADLANENNNESGFVSEEISSNILGQVLTSPFGNIVDMFCDDDKKFTEGVGRGFKKGLEGTWNFFTNDIKKPDTWIGLGKMAVIGAAYLPPMNPLIGEMTLKSLDSVFKSDFVQTKDALVNGVGNAANNAWEDVKRGETGEVGESVGQIQYAIAEAVVGTKVTGLVVKGLSTGAKALIGAERLAALSAKIAKFADAIKQGFLSVVKVGRKFTLVDDAIAKADELIKTLSLSQRGPVLSAIYDPKTGKTFFGQNFNMKRASDRLAFQKFKDELHPLLKDRLKNHNIIDPTGKAGTPGAHSEIRALDDAIKAREAATKKPFTEADLKDFQLHNRGMTSHAPNVSVIRCVHCASLTDGITYIK